MTDAQFRVIIGLLSFIMRGIALIIEPDETLLKLWKKDYIEFIDANR